MSIFQLGDRAGAGSKPDSASAELAAVWNFPYAVPTSRPADVIPTVGFLIGRPNTFSVRPPAYSCNPYGEPLLQL